MVREKGLAVLRVRLQTNLSERWCWSIVDFLVAERND